uniref:Uncharacterized protein n=1 Tax=Globodera rostochiensis TaxID=31243 RepID=A0A914I5N5_GLORO
MSPPVIMSPFLRSSTLFSSSDNPASSTSFRPSFIVSLPLNSRRQYIRKCHRTECSEGNYDFLWSFKNVINWRRAPPIAEREASYQGKVLSDIGKWALLPRLDIHADGPIPLNLVPKYAHKTRLNGIRQWRFAVLLLLDKERFPNGGFGRARDQFCENLSSPAQLNFLRYATGADSVHIYRLNQAFNCAPPEDYDVLYLFYPRSIRLIRLSMHLNITLDIVRNALNEFPTFYVPEAESSDDTPE